MTENDSVALFRKIDDSLEVEAQFYDPFGRKAHELQPWLPPKRSLGQGTRHSADPVRADAKHPTVTTNILPDPGLRAGTCYVQL